MIIFGVDIRIYFLLFMVYSIAGWIMEVICKLIQYKRFINRGFLIGPYCPIYGYGALLITFLLKKYTEDPIALFVMSILITDGCFHHLQQSKFLASICLLLKFFFLFYNILGQVFCMVTDTFII